MIGFKEYLNEGKRIKSDTLIVPKEHKTKVMDILKKEKLVASITPVGDSLEILFNEKRGPQMAGNYFRFYEIPSKEKK